MYAERTGSGTAASTPRPRRRSQWAETAAVAANTTYGMRKNQYSRGTNLYVRLRFIASGIGWHSITMRTDKLRTTKMTAGATGASATALHPGRGSLGDAG